MSEMKRSEVKWHGPWNDMGWWKQWKDGDFTGKMGAISGGWVGKIGNKIWDFNGKSETSWWCQQNWWSADQLVFRWRNSVWDNVCFDFGCLNSRNWWWLMLLQFCCTKNRRQYRVLVPLLWSSGEKKPILHFLCSHPITFSFRKAQWLKLTKTRSLQENQHMGNWKHFRLLAADRCWHPVAYRWPL